MKTILAATDFSPAAHNAAVYAASLAKVFNANLFLYNAYQQAVSPSLQPPAFTSLRELREVAEQHLQNEAAVLDRYSEIRVETISDEEKPATGILKAARNCRANIIVTGMKRSGKGIRKVLGSTVTALISKTDIPVIVVPEEAKSGRIDKIAFATDGDASPDADPHILDMLRELGERFSSKVYLIRITKNKFREAFEIMHRPFKISRMLSTLDPVYECIEGEDVTKALSNFIDKYNIAMLALLPHRHSLMEKWFVKSTTRSMTFETQIPLLILPDLRRSAQESGKKVLLEK
jgi:nucleotide-binding universal stress UspA family protein